MDDGALNDVIVPYHFTESKVAFDIAAEECVDTPHTDMYLNTRLYEVISTNVELHQTLFGTIPHLLQIPMQNKLGLSITLERLPKIENICSFRMCLMIWNLLKLQIVWERQVQIIRTMAIQVLLVATEGRIVFDYICAGGNSTTNETLPMSADLDNTIESTSASMGSVAMMLSESVMVACIWLSARMLH